MSTPIEKIIELNELRIGNYLEYEGKIVHVTMLSMDIDDEYEEQICFCELGKNNNEKGGWNRAICHRLNRIQISPELLKKLGFNFSGILNINDYESEEQYIIRNDETNYVFGIVTSAYGGIPEKYFRFSVDGDKIYLKKNLEYLHQLQNLIYTMTGEELKLQP